MRVKRKCNICASISIYLHYYVHTSLCRDHTAPWKDVMCHQGIEMKPIAISYFEGMGHPIINKGYSPNGMIRRIIILIGLNNLRKIKFQMHQDVYRLNRQFKRLITTTMLKGTSWASFRYHHSQIGQQLCIKVHRGSEVNLFFYNLQEDGKDT